ncbi:MAG: TlpA family protein disulfide reductase [Ruminococcaceae bacterium]|nr:TlpA family protein disulfide reductase [Oscillospiraceae bacterium]
MNKMRIGFVLMMAVVLAIVVGCGQQPPPVQNGEPTSMQTAPTESARTEETQSTQTAATEPTHTSAPDFSVYDENGEKVRLSDFRGKPVVLNFWASWCGPCRREMPEFEEKYKELGVDVTFLMVNLTTWNETVESARALIDEERYTFPVFYDLEGQAAAAYGIQSIPTTFFIDADGFMIAYASGSIDGKTLQKGIDMINGQ